MIPTRRKAGVAALVIAAAAAAGVGTYLPGSAAAGGNGSKAVCGAPAAGDARCHARLLTKDGKTVTTSTPSGYGPSDLQAAYALPSSKNGVGQTVAIVDAYDDPNAVADVNRYRAQFGISTCKSGTQTTSGCTFANNATIRKVNEAGNPSPYPRANGGWAQEISLDLDMVSAVCPNCSILLVEANSASMTDLGNGVNTAVGLHANVVSNSYGGGESSKDPSYDKSYFTHPGVVITASSGDSGYGVQYPAASQYVTAVGGTSLSHNGSAWSETAWSGAGSGCSSYDQKPTWQTAATQCSMRAVADVSAVADPNTGVAVYDSLRYGGASGWLVFGGTSVASPVIASVYALAGNSNTASAQNPWTATGGLNDVIAGSNGNCPSATSVWCNAGTGWDGPTGLGTPNSTSAF